MAMMRAVRMVMLGGSRVDTRLYSSFRKRSKPERRVIDAEDHMIQAGEPVVARSYQHPDIV